MLVRKREPSKRYAGALFIAALTAERTCGRRGWAFYVSGAIVNEASRESRPERVKEA